MKARSRLYRIIAALLLCAVALSACSDSTPAAESSASSESSSASSAASTASASLSSAPPVSTEPARSVAGTEEAADGAELWKLGLKLASDDCLLDLALRGETLLLAVGENAPEASARDIRVESYGLYTGVQQTLFSFPLAVMGTAELTVFPDGGFAVCSPESGSAAFIGADGAKLAVVSRPDYEMYGRSLCSFAVYDESRIFFVDPTLRRAYLYNIQTSESELFSDFSSLAASSCFNACAAGGAVLLYVYDDVSEVNRYLFLSSGSALPIASEFETASVFGGLIYISPKGGGEVRIFDAENQAAYTSIGLRSANEMTVAADGTHLLCFDFSSKVHRLYAAESGAVCASFAAAASGAVYSYLGDAADGLFAVSTELVREDGSVEYDVFLCLPNAACSPAYSGGNSLLTDSGVIETGIASARQAILSNYDIDVLTGESAVRSFDGFSVTEADDASALAAIQVLCETLALFPSGFFNELLFKYITKIEILLVGSINMPSSASPTVGMTTLVGETLVIAVSVNDKNLRSTIAHEFMHAIERRIDYLSAYQPRRGFYLWKSYLPTGFAYDGDYSVMPDVSLTPSDPSLAEGEAWFTDAYSKTNASEDRARLFELLFSDDPTALANVKIYERARYLCEVIDACFDTVDDSAFWMRYFTD